MRKEDAWENVFLRPPSNASLPLSNQILSETGMGQRNSEGRRVNKREPFLPSFRIVALPAALLLVGTFSESDLPWAKVMIYHF